MWNQQVNRLCTKEQQVSLACPLSFSLTVFLHRPKGDIGYFEVKFIASVVVARTNVNRMLSVESQVGEVVPKLLQLFGACITPSNHWIIKRNCSSFRLVRSRFSTHLVVKLKEMSSRGGSKLLLGRSVAVYYSPFECER